MNLELLIVRDSGNCKGDLTMFGGFIPKEGRFFELFIELSEQIVLGATEFRDMLANISEIERRSRNIKAIEFRVAAVESDFFGKTIRFSLLNLLGSNQ